MSSEPRYGHISFELPRAINLVFDLIDNPGFCQGGEQYPNMINAADCSLSLENALKHDVAGYSEDALKAAVDLARILNNAARYDIYDPRYDLSDVGLVTQRHLLAAAELAMDTMPQAWNPEIKPIKKSGHRSYAKK
jgi:hypothetical protein